MRRPVTGFLLLLFLVASLYVTRPVRSSAPAGTAGSERLLGVPTALVYRDGHRYLVGEHDVWRVTLRDGRVTLTRVPWQFVDVPEPSGVGVWRLAELGDGETLYGLGGPVYPSPEGSLTLLVDAGTRRLYETAGTSAPDAVAPDLQVDRVAWAQNGAYAVVLGSGPSGTGLYRVRSGSAPTWIGPVSGTAVGLAATSPPVVLIQSGSVRWVGRGTYDLSLSGAVVGPGGTVLGFHDGEAVVWRKGHVLRSAVPAMPLAVPRFSSDGRTMAYVGQVGRTMEIVILGRDGQVTTTPAPVGDSTVVGLMHGDVLVAVLGGSNAGTYLVTP